MRHSVPSLTIFQNHRFELTDCPPACKVAQAARQSIALGGAEFTIYWPTQRIHQECLYTSQTQSLLNSLLLATTKSSVSYERTYQLRI